MGVKAAELREGDSVVGIGIVREGAQVLVISENGYGKRTPISEYRLQRRGGIGIKTLNVTERTGAMCALIIVDGSEDLMLINDAGVIIRTKVSEISVIGRDTQGVKLMNVGENERVASVTLASPEEEEQEAPA
jgi:DNA gyrase subunit A